MHICKHIHTYTYRQKVKGALVLIRIAADTFAIGLRHLKHTEGILLIVRLVCDHGSLILAIHILYKKA